MAALLQTSSAFAATATSGTDWRDIGRSLLEQIESIRTPDDGMNIGFLYVSVPLQHDLTSLLALLKSVTRIQSWYGATGQAVCGAGTSFINVPAASVLIGKMPLASMQSFMLNDAAPATSGFSCTLVHGALSVSVPRMLGALRDGTFTLGGLTTGDHICDGQVANDYTLSGIGFTPDVPILSAVSPGYANMGGTYVVTQCSDTTIHSINDMPAMAVLREAVSRIDLNDVGGVPKPLHIHVGFEVAGTDGGTVLVRDITQADERAGSITVAHSVARGDVIRFVYRDNETAEQDLKQTLRHLRDRMAREYPDQKSAKAILYFGCAARAPDGIRDEAAVIKDIMGDVPMAGFYTAAEICNGHVFGYTGVIVVFM